MLDFEERPPIETETAPRLRFSSREPHPAVRLHWTPSRVCTPEHLTCDLWTSGFTSVATERFRIAAAIGHRRELTAHAWRVRNHAVQCDNSQRARIGALQLPLHYI